MKKFSDFNIAKNIMKGEKIPICDVIGKSIIVTGFSIFPSKQKSGTDCAKIQFHFKEDTVDRIIFTGSSVLQDQLNAIEKEKFEPFEII